MARHQRQFSWLLLLDEPHAYFLGRKILGYKRRFYLALKLLNNLDVPEELTKFRPARIAQAGWGRPELVGEIVAS